MSLKKYLSEIRSIASETGLYTPLASHIFGAVLGYPPEKRIITKSGKDGIPDIRLFSKEDNSQWIVAEAKLDDDEIRNSAKRQRIWREQILERGYIEPDTFYVVLCAPRTFYVCDLEGKLLETIHIEDTKIVDPQTGAQFAATDQSLRERVHLITYVASLERKQFEAFRKGELPSGRIPLDSATLPQLHLAFSDAIEKLKQYCLLRFRKMRVEYDETKAELSEIEVKLEAIGSGAIKARERLLYRKRSIRAKHRQALALFEDDYERFRHDQTYAGTQEEANFEDIFCTNTAYVVLSRLIFVRICEDVGLTTHKISNSGIAVWRKFVQNIKGNYQDLLEVAFQDVSHIYSSVFELTVFDWFGKSNGTLHDILERILFRLNAFNFKNISRDLLGTIYQYFRPKVERKRLGEYYTPVDVVDYILHRTGITSDERLMEKQILDPACGSFTFGARVAVTCPQIPHGLDYDIRVDG